MRISRRAAPSGLPDTRSPEPAASRGQPAPGLIYPGQDCLARPDPRGPDLWDNMPVSRRTKFEPDGKASPATTPGEARGPVCLIKRVDQPDHQAPTRERTLERMT